MSTQFKVPIDRIPLSSFETNTNDDPTLETISLTLFVAGCVRKCIGCQNPNLQKVTSENHRMFHLDEIKKIIEDRTCLIKSVCFCGGDFFPLYKDQLRNLVGFCKFKNLKTILYTGEMCENIDKYLQKNIDIIVDGFYDYSKKTNKFPASSNQRCWINSNLIDPELLEININAPK